MWFILWHCLNCVFIAMVTGPKAVHNWRKAPLKYAGITSWSGRQEKGDRTNKHFLPPTQACNNAGKSSQTNYFVSTRNGIDDEVKLLMCTLISSCSFPGASLALPFCLRSSHQCAHIKSSSAEKAAWRLETEHLLWVQVSVVPTDVCRWLGLT